MLKAKIIDARIIDETSIKTDEVQILTKVKVKNTKNGQIKEYQLVTEGEANILEGKIAVTTPIDSSIMGSNAYFGRMDYSGRCYRRTTLCS